MWAKVSAVWTQMPPSGSMLMPSGPSPSAQTRRFDSEPSCRDVEGRQPAGEGLRDHQGRAVGGDHHAVGELDVAGDVAGRAVRLDQPDPAGLGRAAAEEVEVGAVDVDVAGRVDDELVAALRAVPRTAEPSGSMRVSSSPETRSRPSGSQSMDQPIVSRPGATTSLRPSRSTATTSPLPQWANHRRPSCQRPDSTMVRPSASSRLHPRPHRRGGSCTGLEDHGGAAGSGAVQVHPVAVDIDQSRGRGEGPPIDCGPYRLVQHPGAH